MGLFSGWWLVSAANQTEAWGARVIGDTTSKTSRSCPSSSSDLPVTLGPGTVLWILVISAQDANTTAQLQGKRGLHVLILFWGLALFGRQGASWKLQEAWGKAGQTHREGCAMPQSKEKLINRSYLGRWQTGGYLCWLPSGPHFDSTGKVVGWEGTQPGEWGTSTVPQVVIF